METIDNMVFGKTVCAKIDRREHVKKHNLDMSTKKIIDLADKVTKGIEGLHVLYSHFEKPITIVVRGFVEKEGKKYGVVRTVWDGECGWNKFGKNGLFIIRHHLAPLLTYENY